MDGNALQHSAAPLRLPVSLTTTPAAIEQAHQAFLATYNTTAHQGLLKDRFDPPIALEVLGEAKGRTYSPEELSRKFAHDLFPRTTNLYGCVTLHHYHFYGEQGLPTTQVLLWLSGDLLRAVFDHVVVAEYRCQYDWRICQVKDIRDGVFYPTRDASLQGALIPFNPRESLVLYCPRSGRRHARQALPTQQLSLFEGVPNIATTFWLFVSFDTDGEVTFAGDSHSANQRVERALSVDTG